MKRVVRFDSIGGASGDMILGALVAAGADAAAVRRAVEALPLDGCTVAFHPYQDKGFTGMRARVSVPTEPHTHRGLSAVRDILEAAGLDSETRTLAIRVFERLAEAEARVHGVSVEAIHFHEVGALDAIVDIVGGCAALRSLAPDRVEVGALPVGRGSIEAAHGTLPLPVPAVVALLGPHPVVPTDIPVELVTPTGAALLMTWREFFSGAVRGGLSLRGSGYGFGAQTLPGRADALRVSWLESVEAGLDAESCHVLECNLDDMTPELVGSLCERLMEAGALDVFTTAVQMKKQRPGVLLTVLCDASRRDGLVNLIFEESTTFGIREHQTSRSVLQRTVTEVETPYGPIRIKCGFRAGTCLTRSPEHADCQARAKAGGVSVRKVYAAASLAARDLAPGFPSEANG